MKNPRVFFYAILGLICVALAFTVNWLFIIPAVILSGIGWRLLIKKD